MEGVVIGRDRHCHDPHLDDPNHGDLVIVVNDEARYHVHRILLSLWSPVFDRMLGNRMKETSDDVVHLQEEKEHEKRFGQVLTHLYPYSRVVVDRYNVYSFLYFIDKYDLPAKIKDECEEYLLGVDRSWNLLQTAQRYGLRKLQLRHVIWASARLDGNLAKLNPAVLAQLDNTTLTKILLHTAKRVEWVRDLTRKMSLARNCNICQALLTAHILPPESCCSHLTQFSCLLHILDEC